MRKETLISRLRRLHLASPAGLLRFAGSLAIEGVNLMAMLRFSRHYYPSQPAVSDGQETIDYATLYTRAKAAASALYHRHGVRSGMRVGVLCRNRIELLYALFGISAIGADLFLLNPDMSDDQLNEQLRRTRIGFCLCESRQIVRIDPEGAWHIIHLDGLDLEASTQPIPHPRLKRGQLAVLTGGTSGRSRTAARKPSVVSFLAPFFALIQRAGIDRHHKVYIAPPVYHGFGLAAVIVTLLMGKTLYLLQQFDAARASQLIIANNIDLLIAVPTMLRRMVNGHTDGLRRLGCILSGGAPLDEKLVRHIEAIAGQVLYNLYGTSEAGFFVMATPADLHRYPLCLGRPIPGVDVRLTEQTADGVGVLCVKSGWAMEHARNRWQSTGDLAIRNREGLLFLKGRADGMIVSGGENVYPEEVEAILLTHPHIEQAIVTAVETDDFGTRLQAFVVPTAPLTETELTAWLKPRLARYQMPQQLRIVDHLPILSTGKIARNEVGCSS